MQRQSPHDPLRTGEGKPAGAATPGRKNSPDETDGAGAVSSGRLIFVRGAANVTLRVASPLADLFQAQFKGQSPEVRIGGGAVSVTYPRRFGPADWDQARAVFTLNGALPWEIEFDSVSKLNAALSGLQLRAFDVTGGISRGRITMPTPAGIVFVRFAGSVSHVRLHRPVGVAVRIVVRQAVSELTFDDQHFAVVSEDLSLETPDYQQVGNRYDIEVAGSASDLTITTETSSERAKKYSPKVTNLGHKQHRPPTRGD